VTIDWEDNTKRKVFREALQEVYPSAAALEVFVDEELNENLATVADGANLQVTAHGLIKWAKAKGRLDEVYEAFKGQNPKHPVIEKLEWQAQYPQIFKLTQADWDRLFALFLLDDLADLQRAFKQGFEEALGLTFQRARPNYPPLIKLAQIRELLERYDVNSDGPVLAVRFVESAIAELQRSSKDGRRDLTVLEQWRDRITLQHNVPPKPTEPVKTAARHAYLLVALEEYGAGAGAGPNVKVNVYPELHVTGGAKPINFGAGPTTCSVNKVADQISRWIAQAEDAPEISQCEEEEVTLELFLPCKYLEADVAMTWSVKDKRGDEVLLGTHRRFLVRSSERIRDRKIQKVLMQRWQRLEACVSEGNGCSQFHLQEDCFEQKGALYALLKDVNATGLKLVAKLPTDPGKRIDLLHEIIDAAIPIAIWSSDLTEADVNILKTEFDSLLRQCHLTNFADLARQWRMRRTVSASAKHIRLLCDRPDRLPRLPDPDREEDLLVAS